MKIYFNRPKGEYGKNKKSGTQTFIDKFYNMCEKNKIEITNDINSDYDIHFVMCLDDNIVKSNEKGKKIIMRLDGLYSVACGGNWKEMNEKIISQTLYADYVIFLNEFCRDTFKHFAGWLPKNYSLISNGCDINQFQCNLNKQFKNNILHYGEMRRENAIKPMLDSIDLIKKEIPDCELWIVGGGKQEIINKIPKKDYIKIIGPINNFDLPVFAQECSVMSCPVAKAADHSIVSECLSCGLPVVCYDNGGVHYKVKDAGIILKSEYYEWDRFPNENPQEYADAIIKVLNNKEEYFKKALERRDDLNLEKMEDKYIKVFEEVLK